MQLLALGSSLLIREMANEGQNKQEANLIFVSGGRPGFKVMGKQEDDGHFWDRKEAHLSSGGFRERTAESGMECGPSGRFAHIGLALGRPAEQNYGALRFGDIRLKVALPAQNCSFPTQL